MKLQQLEQAARQRRHWVRLNYTCNNRCQFCLDADLQDGSSLTREALEAEIAAGKQQGAERLILSGGEATIHPHFLDLVTYGKELGYHWVQAISNGRMFAYPKFARQAVAAGLDEVTLSLHGHRAELHDALVGVPGAFAQALRGLDNLLSLGLVVSVDIVLCARNLPELEDMMQFYLDRGVGEFDLLWPVPFGRAWKNRERIFPDRAQARVWLRAALELAQGQGAVIWTNRLPAELLQGFEQLIQDPYKLHDEVRGRRQEFAELLENGTRLQCRQEGRCRYCHLEQFCGELERSLEQPRGGELPEAAVGVPAGSREETESALAGEGPVRIALNRETARWLEENLPRVRQQPRRFHLSLQGFAELSEMAGRAIDPRQALLPLASLPVVLEGIPPCLLPTATVAELPPLPLAEGGAGVDLERYTDDFIRQRAAVHAVDCVRCQRREECRGLAVQYARKFGLGLLRPLGEGDELCGMDVSGGEPASLVIRTPCSNACTFCTTRIINAENQVPWQVDSLERIERSLERIADSGFRSLRLAAIEPMEHPNIVAVLRRARELGFTAIEVWSHAGPLADPDLAERVVEAGLTRLRVPIFGPGARLHDEIAGRPGAYAQTLAAVANLKRLGVAVDCHVVLTRGNHLELARTARACRARGLGFPVAVVIAAPSSDDVERFRPVAFKYDEALRALAKEPGVDDNVRLRLLGMLASALPTCLVRETFPGFQPEAGWKQKGSRDAVRISSYRQSSNQAGPTRGYELKQAGECPYRDECRLSPACPGVNEKYLAIFGADDLRPG